MGIFHRLLAVCAVPLIAVLLGPAPSASATTPSPSASSIAEARRLSLGREVTVEGSVTTPSGAFESSFFDKGFGLQDNSAGIYVKLTTDRHAVVGMKARVTGVLTDSYGLLTLVPVSPFDVWLSDADRTIEPKRVRTKSVNEATEGLLVQVLGKVTREPVRDLDFGYKFFVNDGSGELQIFVNLETGISLSDLRMGDLVKVTGFSSQFDTHYEIDPRSPRDIQIVRS
ncbi:hypothetical protein [Streptomyces chartreusis]|uniref:hypothetical protein n=1 Tax=Streptomyces chartreusis TaxID=1969 RepID=UPI003805C982